MRVGFCTFEKQSNRPTGTIGSTRIRARWLYDNWAEAEEYKIGTKYDVLIFQKVYWETMMTEFEGIKILDLCDPDWLEGKDVMRYCALADAVVTSTQPLADYITKYVKDMPVICIPDRVAIEEHKPYQKKVHKEKIQSVAWFGYSGNFKYAERTLKELAKRNVRLTAIADKEVSPFHDYDVEISNVKHTYPAYHAELSKHDVALLPVAGNVDYRGTFKSNNKTLTCWALGIPVIHVPEDFDRLATRESREKEAVDNLLKIKKDWLVEQSVQEYKDLIEQIKAKPSSKKA